VPDDEPAVDELADAVIERMSHWASGWVEYLLVRPGSAAEAKALEWRARLNNYPVADEGTSVTSVTRPARDAGVMQRRQSLLAQDPTISSISWPYRDDRYWLELQQRSPEEFEHARRLDETIWLLPRVNGECSSCGPAMGDRPQTDTRRA